MGKEMTLLYDRTADILYINFIEPYPEQETEELGDDVIVRLHPKTGDVENMEILFFSTRLLRNDLLKLPITGSFHLIPSSATK